MAKRNGFSVVRKGKGYTILRTGNTLLVSFAGRWRALFGIVNCGELTHFSDVDYIQHDAECIITGMYRRLMTFTFVSLTAPVPTSEYRY